MSNTSLIKWFEKLLFGQSEDDDESIPLQVTNIVSRLQADGIRLQDYIPRGGLVQFHYTVHSDLYRFIEHLEKDNDENYPPIFKTKMIQQFYKQLMIIFAQRKSKQDTTLLPLPPPPDDQKALDIIKSGQNEPIEYHSASFWGDFARRLLNHRRPIETQLFTLRSPSHKFMKRLNWLYDIACQTRGEVFDPLTTVMIPFSEHVDSVHFQSETLLENFVQKYPDHILSKSIRNLICKNVRELLNGTRPSGLPTEDIPDIEVFLVNVSVIHDSIHDIPSKDQPPKTIDVFQRLLALTERDHLWQDIPATRVETISSTWNNLLQLTERLHLAERQNGILHKYIRSLE